MYAYRRHYVKQYEYQKPEERYSVAVTRDGKPVEAIRPDRVASIDEEVMYWRKAYHIHQWFVENVQDGVDNCAEYCVDRHQLEALKALCEQVLEHSKLVDGQVNNGRTWSEEHPEGEIQWIPGKVIEDATVAMKLLPTVTGFFFGGTEYDEWYLNNVRATRDWLDRELSEPGAESFVGTYYSSSW